MLSDTPFLQVVKPISFMFNTLNVLISDYKLSKSQKKILTPNFSLENSLLL